MKLFLTLLFVFSVITGVYADDKYEQAMKKNLSKMDECKNANDYIKLANTFERIALAEGGKWLPYYYTALNYILASYIDSSNTQKDIYLDKAVEFNSKADSLVPNNSEIYTLKGMIAQARMQIDPMNRWQKYGGEAQYELSKSDGGGFIKSSSRIFNWCWSFLHSQTIRRRTGERKTDFRKLF